MTFTPLAYEGEDRWRFYCHECYDTGWREFWCGPRDEHTHPNMPNLACGRRHDGPKHAHGWAERCPCEPTNPDIQKRKARLAAYAAKPGKAMD